MRTIVITGITGLIGRVLAKHFLGSGDVVIGIGRSPDSLDRLKAEMEENADGLHCISIDLSSENACNQLQRFLESASLLPDCLINNARDASYLRISGSGTVARGDFMGELLLDVVVPYELTMALAMHSKSMLKSVVNIGSQYGIVAPNLSLYSDSAKASAVHYGVAKAGLVHLTKELAVRLSSQSIRVNCVAYGGVEGRVDDDFKKRYSKLCPIGRMLNESDLSAPVDLLLSPAASGITGHTLVVDGGWSIW
jgi:NAD(P)-dependent dehydrogenase (short-subunit alcohol dehydrogenase family)